MEQISPPKRKLSSGQETFSASTHTQIQQLLTGRWGAVENLLCQQKAANKQGDQNIIGRCSRLNYIYSFDFLIAITRTKFSRVCLSNKVNSRTQNDHKFLVQKRIRGPLKTLTRDSY